MRNNRPAEVGMPVDAVITPCLLVELDAFERNVARMAEFARQQGLRLRPHAKTHKSPAIALYQVDHGAVGVCCQKVSEAEALFDGGVRNILVSNQVIQPPMIERLAALACQARILVCVDDADNIDALDAAARRFGSHLEVLVEIDVGAGRCGVAPGEAAVALARRVAGAGSLGFAGLQAYHGAAQHVRDFNDRRHRIDQAIEQVSRTLALLHRDGLPCPTVAGAGTGTYRFEGASGVYNELQSGSYIFMDADYQRIRDEQDRPIDEFENSLFILTTVMSKTRPDRAVCDAGLKAQSVDSGLPLIHGRDDVAYTNASDEHGVIRDPDDMLRLGERLRLVPGHCDPTVNVHDWLVGIRDGHVECLWPVAARGMCL